MSKYDSLWKYVQNSGMKNLKLTFEEIQRQVEFRVIQKTPAASDTGVYEIRIKDNGNRYEPGISKAYCRLPADCLRGSPISP